MCSHTLTMKANLREEFNEGLQSFDDDMMMIWWWCDDDMMMIWWWFDDDMMMICWWFDDDMISRNPKGASAILREDKTGITGLHKDYWYTPNHWPYLTHYQPELFCLVFKEPLPTTTT